MKRQYLRLFSFLIGITFIVSGILFTFVNKYKIARNQERADEKVIADEIGNVYKTFYDKEVKLTTFRDELLKEMKESLEFFTDIPEGYDSIMPKVEEYETLIIEVQDLSVYLSEKCEKRYSVLEANDQCDAYYKNLEKTINIFIEDTNILNAKIKAYNEWTETENNSLTSTETYEKLDEYKIKKYTDYVDLNDDGTYLGRTNE